MVPSETRVIAWGLRNLSQDQDTIHMILVMDSHWLWAQGRGAQGIDGLRYTVMLCDNPDSAQNSALARTQLLESFGCSLEVPPKMITLKALTAGDKDAMLQQDGPRRLLVRRVLNAGQRLNPTA